MTTDETKEAWNLCQEAWQSIMLRYGDEAKATDFTPRERVIVAVWTIFGIIGNGGFEYLFEGELPGDPDYQFSLGAFRTIGCAQAVAAFEGALALFPGGLVSHSDEERTRVFRSSPEEVREGFSRSFLKADDAIVRNLGEFIRREATS